MRTEALWHTLNWPSERAANQKKKEIPMQSFQSGRRSHIPRCKHHCRSDSKVYDVAMLSSSTRIRWWFGHSGDSSVEAVEQNPYPMARAALSKSARPHREEPDSLLPKFHRVKAAQNIAS